MYTAWNGWILKINDHSLPDHRVKTQIKAQHLCPNFVLNTILYIPHLHTKHCRQMFHGLVNCSSRVQHQGTPGPWNSAYEFRHVKLGLYDVRHFPSCFGYIKDWITHQCQLSWCSEKRGIFQFTLYVLGCGITPQSVWRPHWLSILCIYPHYIYIAWRILIVTITYVINVGWFSLPVSSLPCFHSFYKFPNILL